MVESRTRASHGSGARASHSDGALLASSRWLVEARSMGGVGLPDRSIIHLEPHSAPALGCDWQLVDDCGARSISVRVLRAFHLARRSSRSSVAAPSHKNNRFFVPHLLTSAARTYERTGNVKLIIIHPMRTGWRRQQHTQTDIIESTYSQLNRTTICCYSLLLIIIVIVVIVCSSNNTASGGLLRIYNVRYSAGTCSCLCVCVYMSAATVTTTNIKHQSVVILT